MTISGFGKGKFDRLLAPLFDWSKMASFRPKRNPTDFFDINKTATGFPVIFCCNVLGFVDEIIGSPHSDFELRTFQGITDWQEKWMESGAKESDLKSS